MFLLTPIILPVAELAGVDPVHLGIAMTLNITIALIAPPMGACLFVAVAWAVLLVVILVPGSTTWLPSRLM